MNKSETLTGEAINLIAFLSQQAVDNPGVVYDLSVHREKRTLTQNSYYWSLVSKVAGVLKISKSRVHNLMIRDYGQRELFGDKIAPIYIPDTEEAENEALEADTFHIKPTSQVKEGNNGVMYRAYVLMRGSSTYNVQEMSVLLDGLIEEAKQLDIETLPPDELARMRQYEEQKNESLRDT